MSESVGIDTATGEVYEGENRAYTQDLGKALSDYVARSVAEPDVWQRPTGLFTGAGTESVTSVVLGIAQVQAKMQVVRKSAHGQEGQGNYAYAPYEAVWGEIQPHLLEAKLALTFFHIYEGERHYEVLRVYQIETGEFLQYVLPLSILDMRTAMKAMAATKTYGRRYLLLDAFGIACEDDPDLDDETEPRPHQTRQAAPRPQKPKGADPHTEAGDQYIDSNAQKAVHVRAAQRAKKLFPDATPKEQGTLANTIAESALRQYGCLDEDGRATAKRVTQGKMLQVLRAIDDSMAVAGSEPPQEVKDDAPTDDGFVSGEDPPPFGEPAA
jgi:hypothetical protein